MKVASRKAGNGGYKKKSKVPDPKMVRRSRERKNYHGKTAKFKK